MEGIKKYLNENQDPKAVEKLLARVKDLLTKDERVEYIAVQKKPLVNFSPDCIALTNRRIIFCRPKMFGLSMDFQDYLWKDIADCHIKEELLGAIFSVKTTKGSVNFMDHLPKAQVRQLYRYGQEREEEMREYRRQQTLEHARASAGGVVVNNGTGPEKSIMSIPEEPAASLKKLKDLLDNQLIDVKEYDAKKAEILARM